MVFLAKTQLGAALATQVSGFLDSLETHSALLPQSTSPRKNGTGRVRLFLKSLKSIIEIRHRGVVQIHVHIRRPKVRLLIGTNLEDAKFTNKI